MIKINNVQTLFKCPKPSIYVMGLRRKIMHISASFLIMHFFLKVFAPFLILYWAISTANSQLTQKNKKKRKEKIRKLYPAQSVKSFFFSNQNLINSSKSVHLCTLTYYTHLVYLHNSAMHVCLCCTCVLVTFLSLPRHAVIREYQICCMRPHTWDWSSSQCIP